jgi:hypothetical protein
MADCRIDAEKVLNSDYTRRLIEILKACDELKPFYEIMKSLTISAYQINKKDAEHWICGVENLFSQFEQKIKDVVYEVDLFI